MIKVTDLSFGFPKKDLYNKICFEINEKDHAVLIGSNGTGKSTLIEMLIDDEKYLYEGKIEREDNIRIGYVSQYVSHEGNMAAYDYLAEPFLAMQAKADEACTKMENAEDMEKAYEEYQKCLDEIEAVDGYNYDTNVKKQLAISGLSKIEKIAVDKISGGEYKLLSIIKNMLLKPQLLIMDEPDVFLDFDNLVGLSKLINMYEGTILVITHNRLLLSQCFNKILHLENEELQEFPGTFAEYNTSMLEAKVEMKEQATKDTEWIEIQKKYVEKLRLNATRIADPVRGKQLKARVSYLERLEAKRVMDPFIEEQTHEFSFPEVDINPDNIQITVKDYSLSYEKTLLSNVNFEIKEGEKVAIVGANGSGKSSMLKDIYNMLKDAEKVAFFTQIYEDNDKLSGGEKNLKQLKTIADSDANILLLDEPTSHLDTYAQIALENAIMQYKGTVVMVSHDFYTVTNCADKILLLENGTLREMSGRAFRKMVYKQYFDSDLFEQERLRKEREIKVNAYVKAGKIKEAKALLNM